MLAGYADTLLSLFRSWRAIAALEQVLPWIIGFCESFFFYVLCSVIWYGSGYISTSCGILHDVPSLFGFIGMMPCAGFASSFWCGCILITGWLFLMRVHTGLVRLEPMFGYLKSSLVVCRMLAWPYWRFRLVQFRPILFCWLETFIPTGSVLVNFVLLAWSICCFGWLHPWTFFEMLCLQTLLSLKHLLLSFVAYYLECFLCKLCWLSLLMLLTWAGCALCDRANCALYFAFLRSVCCTHLLPCWRDPMTPCSVFWRCCLVGWSFGITVFAWDRLWLFISSLDAHLSALMTACCFCRSGFTPLFRTLASALALLLIWRLTPVWFVGHCPWSIHRGVVLSFARSLNLIFYDMVVWRLWHGWWLVFMILSWSRSYRRPYVELEDSERCYAVFYAPN